MSDRFTARRINVVGTSAVGKTSMAAALAALLAVPHVELDAYASPSSRFCETLGVGAVEYRDGRDDERKHGAVLQG